MTSSGIANVNRTRNLTERMNKLMAEVTAKVECDAECHRQRSIAEKKRNWEEARSLYELGLSNVDEKERIYLDAQFGEKRASELLVKKYTKQAADSVSTQLDKVKALNQEHNGVLRNLEGVLRTGVALNRLMDILTTERNQLQTATATTLSDIHTNDERTRFSDEALGRISTYFYGMLVLYAICYVVYLVKGPFINSQEFDKWRGYLVPTAFLSLAVFSRYLAYMLMGVWENITWFMSNGAPKDVYIDLR